MTNPQHRHGESGAIPFRSGRLYFLTREGGQMRPYENREEAEASLILFVRNQRLAFEQISTLNT